MSADGELSERDSAVLNDASTPPEEQSTEETDHVDAMRAATTGHQRQTHGVIDELREMLHETRRELAEERNARVNLEEQLTNTKPDQTGDEIGTTIIESYAEMGEEERQDLVGVSDRRAAVLFNHWWDMAKQAGNGNYVITTHRNSTLKNNPAQVKIDLEKYTGEDLHWEEVYRAMRHLAKKSVDDTDNIVIDTDGAGRKHILGGAFEYHERATPDGSDTYKVVELVDEDSLTAL